MTKFVRNPRGHKNLPEEEVQVVGEFLEELKEKAEKLDSATVVDAARPKKSPIHKYFDWDDSKAAELYRRQQAIHLIHSINVVIENEGVEHEVRAFINLTSVGTDSGDGYQGALEVRTIDRDKATHRALAELRQWRFRWLGVPELERLSMLIERGIEMTEARLNGGKEELVEEKVA